MVVLLKIRALGKQGRKDLQANTEQAPAGEASPPPAKKSKKLSSFWGTVTDWLAADTRSLFDLRTAIDGEEITQ